MPARAQTDDFFGVGMMSANPYANRYQPIHDMAMSAAGAMVPGAGSRSSPPPLGLGGGGANFVGRGDVNYAQGEASVETPLLLSRSVPRGWDNMFTGTAYGTNHPPVGPGGPAMANPPSMLRNQGDGSDSDEPTTPDGRPYPYPGGPSNPQNQALETRPTPYVYDQNKQSNIPPDLGPLRQHLQDFYLNALLGHGQDGRYDPSFSRESLTLNMDPSWSKFNDTMYNALGDSRSANARGMGYLDWLMQRNAPQADFSAMSPFLNAAMGGTNTLSNLASGGAWNQGYANTLAGGPGMSMFLSAMNPSGNPLFGGAANGVGMSALRNQALTGGRTDINPALEAIRTQGMNTLTDTLAQIREQYGAMGLGASSDVNQALATGASRGIADIVRQQSELAAGLDTQAQNRMLSAGGAEQSAMASLFLGSQGQALSAGGAYQDTMSNLLGQYINAFGQNIGASSALANTASNTAGMLGQLGLGQAGLQSQHLAQLFGGANSYLTGAQGYADAAAKLTPGLSAYPQEKSRLDEANLARWYNEQLRYAMGPPILAQATGYAANVPQQPHPPYQNPSGWPGAIGAIGGGLMGALPWLLSDRNAKEDITPVNTSILEMVKDLPISTWRYKGDTTRHIGPMAQDFQEKFGVGDGRHIHLVDVMGVMLQGMKELAHATS